MPWGIYIPVDETAPLEFRLFGQLTDYQEAVGGWIEAIDIDMLSASFFCHDEGKVEGLPLNRRATLLFWLDDLTQIDRDVLVGNVVLIGQPDSKGETQDVPDEAVTLLLKTESYKYEVMTLGDDKWYGNQARFESYFEAANAGLGLLERWSLASKVRVAAA